VGLYTPPKTQKNAIIVSIFPFSGTVSSAHRGFRPARFSVVVAALILKCLNFALVIKQSSKQFSLIERMVLL
jgi:hypothetical protein